jgi:hypothetical protein
MKVFCAFMNGDAPVLRNGKSECQRTVKRKGICLTRICVLMADSVLCRYGRTRATLSVFGSSGLGGDRVGMSRDVGTRGGEMLRRKQIVWVVGLILCAVAAASSQSAVPKFSEPSPTKDRPILTLDLHKFAGANWNLRDDDKAGATLDSAIEFADSDLISWEWTTRDEPSLRVKPGTPIQSHPLHHHAVVLSLTTGEKKAEMDFYAPQYAGYFRAISEGHFLACLGNKIRVFSSGFELLREQDLPAPSTCFFVPNSKQAGVSPSRHSILVSTRHGKGSNIKIIDASALAVISQRDEDASGSISSISDHWVVAQCGKSWEVCIRPMDGSWRTFSFTGPEYQSPTRVLGQPYFVNDDTFVICRMNEIAVAKVDGAVLVQSNLPEDISCDNSLPVTSIDGSRFAIMENKELKADEFFDMGPFWTDDKIVVYDISERRAIFAVKVNGTGQWAWSHTHSNEFALSPDGDRLAVVSDGILRIYKLPVRTSAN